MKEEKYKNNNKIRRKKAAKLRITLTFGHSDCWRIRLNAYCLGGKKGGREEGGEGRRRREEGGGKKGGGKKGGGKNGGGERT